MNQASPQSPAAPPQQRTIVMGLTGASGAAYAVRLLEVLLAAGVRVQLSISPAAAIVVEQELGRKIDLQAFSLAALLGHDARELPGQADYYHYQDLMSPMASGSARSEAMVVCPCSGGTLSAIAHAASGNLIHRAAEVHLKERRKLLLVTREMPLSLPQIENMRLCTLAGALVMPASPGFYHRPQSLGDLVDFVVARLADQLDVPHRLMGRWGESEGDREGNALAGPETQDGSAGQARSGKGAR